ncbi:MAG: hypothetical protein HC936_07005 [Leptolyngbyaceae cyanobacterium SU_3_3]|nr:hypothetical protein [Leptolyngbyaceae cyanobacterium SU_3_3]NJR51588.1 hypothetical protein [Leptolyngbyaceae cyanobacterium CSU_1_3]
MSDRPQTSQLVEQIMKDPLLLQKLRDRVYELLLEDIRYQSERTTHPRRYR